MKLWLLICRRRSKFDVFISQKLNAKVRGFGHKGFAKILEDFFANPLRFIVVFAFIFFSYPSKNA
jgi:hypothetical protein